MLGFDKDFYPLEFISSYIIDELEPKLALCFKNSDSDDLKECLDVLQGSSTFKNIDFDDDNNEVITIHNIPKEHYDNFKNFKIGRYTQFDTDYKELLMDVHGRVSGNGTCIMMIDALYPSFQAKKFRADKSGCNITDLPNGEVMSIPDMDQELYCRTSELTKSNTNIK